MAFIKSCSIDSRNAQSPSCEVVQKTNKAHFRNLLPNRFLPRVMIRRLWNPTPLGTNFENFFSSLRGDLSDNLTETRIAKNPNGTNMIFHTAISDVHGFLKNVRKSTGRIVISIIINQEMVAHNWVFHKQQI